LKEASGSQYRFQAATTAIQELCGVADKATPSKTASAKSVSSIDRGGLKPFGALAQMV
jgi:hypothetical protein